MKALSSRLIAFESGLDDTATAAGFDPTATDLSTMIGLFISSLFGFLGVIFLVLMVYAGFLYMTAQGNEDQVEKAKGMIKNAIIGIVIVMLAYAITTFVTEQVIGNTGFSG